MTNSATCKLYKSFLRVASGLLVVIACGQSVAQEHSAQDYIAVPVGQHLQVASLKLEQKLREAEAAGETKKVAALDEARRWLDVAKQKYFDSQSYFIITDVLPDSPGKSGEGKQTEERPDLAESPLPLLQHLRIAHEEAIQKWGQGNRASSLDEEAVESLKALGEAVDAMKVALRYVEESRDWVEHRYKDGAFSINAPPAYEVFEHDNLGLLRLQVLDNDGETKKLVFVSYWKKESEWSLSEFVDVRIDNIRNRLQDVHDVEQGRFSSSNMSLERWFSYRYTWNEDPVKAIVFISSGYNNGVFGVQFAAREPHFDREEFEEMFRTFKNH